MKTGLCGWLGSEPADAASAVLCARQMSERLLPADTAMPIVHAAKHGAVAYVGESAARLRIEGDLMAIICGAPRWSSTELHALAEREGPAAALVEAYRRYDVELLQCLWGTFSFALIDAGGDTALLATDRMGVEPLYYAVGERGGLAFGSTATSIQTHPAFRSAIDPQAVYAYLYFHVIPSPLAIFMRQRKLLPAQRLLYRAGRVETKFYWEAMFTDGNDETPSGLATELHARLRAAVTRCADPHAGTFLSGGVDSSTVSGLLAVMRATPVKTFSIGFEAAGYDEMYWARVAARHFRTEQHEHYVTPADVARAAPLVARAYDEPFGNSSAVAVYECARLARAHGVRTMLAGDGGDELFGGNARYAKQKLFEFYHRLPVVLRQRLVEPWLLSDTAARWAPLRKGRSYVAQARLPLPDRLETYNFLQRTGVEDVLHPDLLSVVDRELPLRLLRETYFRARSRSIVNRMLFLDWKFTLADNDLRKVSRMCQLAGLNVRYPFLDDDLVALSLRIPPGLKVKGTKLRYFFKQAMRDFLPAPVIAKKKHGFGLPFGVWMKEHRPLQELAYDSLHGLAQRNYVQASYLSQLVKLHRDEHAAYYGEFIWVLMMLELWLKQQPHR